MLGLDNAGKTTILMRFMKESILGIPPTVGFNIKTKSEYIVCKDGTGNIEGANAGNLNSSFKLNIWDVGGQRSIRTFWRNYFEQTDGLIWVVDSADVFRLDDCRKELHALLKEERLAGASLLVFANKQDLPGALSIYEISEFLQISDIQKGGRHCQVVSCSAWEDQGGVENGFQWIVADIASRVYVLR